jgi:heterodisulfide reductase subunit B
MNGIAYFPGCSLKETAKTFEASASFLMNRLGLPLIELERWNCCGTVASLSDDDLMHHVASVRNLLRAQEAGGTELVALCAMCYNTLHRVADRVNEDVEARTKINAFMDREADYTGEVEVLHLLGILRDRLGWDRLSEAVTHPLEGLRVAGYYGCTLLRPRSAGVDDSERPTVLGDAMTAVGADPISFPFEGECCGSYQVVDRKDLSIERSWRILSSAQRAGAHVIATACPLCLYNLTETLALALGQPEQEWSESIKAMTDRLGVPVKEGA